MSFGTRLAIVSAVFLALAAPVRIAAADALPRPAGLEPDIGFWRRVFGEVTSRQVIVHDDRYLGVVYEVFDLPESGADSERRRLMANAETRYSRILETLATGRRAFLSDDERRVLDLWPANTTNDQFRAAAARVRAQQGVADRFRQGMVRSGRWEPHIRVQLRDAGVPENLSALPHVESSFNPAAQSSVGAVGLWQFTRGTGRRFMRIDQAVDERRDPFASSEAAAQLLRSNHAVLGTWPLAITAYNHGTTGMKRAERAMGTKDIETIVRNYDGPAFGFASRNFYVAFLAADEVDRNHQKYFGSIDLEPAEDHDAVVVPAYVGVAALERSLGLSRATLRQYNPALLPAVWSGSRYVPRGYRLRLPPATEKAEAEQRLAAIPAAEVRSGQAGERARTHRVRRGESLSLIAKRYRTSAATLAKLNRLSSRNLVRVGQVLRLPGGDGGSVGAPAVRTASTVAKSKTYTVRRGDSLKTIARKTGVPERTLVAINSLGDPNRIFPGQKLKLRGQSEGG